MKTVNYKGEVIAAGTQAYKLYEEKKFKELDAHMKGVNATYHSLHGTLTVAAEATPDSEDPRAPSRCTKCGRSKAYHRKPNLLCPIGLRGPRGFTRFSETDTYEGEDHVG